MLLASELNTIRGVQIQAGAICIYIYIGMCAIIVLHATYTYNVGEVRPRGGG